MRTLLCIKCRQYIKETEFEYFYFERRYNNTCKKCDLKPQSQPPNKIDDPERSGKDLKRS